MTRTVAGRPHSFSHNPVPNIQRSRFDRSCNRKTAFDVGKLVPLLVDEILPGDTIELSPTVLCRLATPLHPLMDNLYVDVHCFFVPNRLVWNNWHKFLGAQDNPGDSIDFEIPTVTTVAGSGWLSDFMGISVVGTHTVNALPFRGYHLIWNEWFRSEELQTSAVVDKDDGPDNIADYAALKVRNKRFDYFTQALTNPQRGTTVDIPIGSIVPDPTDPVPTFEMVGPGSSTGHPYTLIHGDAGVYHTNDEAAALNRATNTGTVTDFTLQWSDPSLTVAATSINTLREQWAIQALLERDARSGTRLQEIIYGHFKIMGADARLQRPEFLGMMTTRMGIQAVPQTSETGTTAQGTLTGYGVTVDTGRTIHKSFDEHGYLFVLASVRPDQTYHQGIHRMWTRSTKYDFYWPGLAGLGEQAVLSREIYADGTANDDNVFGYVPRFDEYRYGHSTSTAHMRSDHGTSLDTWTLQEDFASRPSLNSTFIQVDYTATDRAIAVPSEPHIICDAFIQLHHTRPMPTFGIPAMLGRF